MTTTSQHNHLTPDPHSTAPVSPVSPVELEHRGRRERRERALGRDLAYGAVGSHALSGLLAVGVLAALAEPGERVVTFVVATLVLLIPFTIGITTSAATYTATCYRGRERRRDLSLGVVNLLNGAALGTLLIMWSGTTYGYAYAALVAAPTLGTGLALVLRSPTWARTP